MRSCAAGDDADDTLMMHIQSDRHRETTDEKRTIDVGTGQNAYPVTIGDIVETDGTRYDPRRCRRRPLVMLTITIIIDIVDRAKDQLVWRGWVVRRNRDGNFDEAEIARAVNTILMRFPPGR